MKGKKYVCYLWFEMLWLCPGQLCHGVGGVAQVGHPSRAHVGQGPGGRVEVGPRSLGRPGPLHLTVQLPHTRYVRSTVPQCDVLRYCVEIVRVCDELPVEAGRGQPQLRAGVGATVGLPGQARTEVDSPRRAAESGLQTMQQLHPFLVICKVQNKPRTRNSVQAKKVWHSNNLF